MKFEYIDAAMKASGLTHPQKSVLLAYCIRADDHGYSYPGKQRIADDMGLSPRAVGYAKKALLDAGLIFNKARADQNGRQIADLVRVNLAALRAIERAPRDYKDNVIEEITFPAGAYSPESLQEFGGAPGAPPNGGEGASGAPPVRTSCTPGGAPGAPKESQEQSVELSLRARENEATGTAVLKARDAEREERSNSNDHVPQQPTGSGEARFAPELQQIGTAYRNAYGETMPPAAVSAAVKADAIALLEAKWPAAWIAKLAGELPGLGYASLAKHAEHNPPPANIRQPQSAQRCYRHPSTLASACGLCASEAHVDNTLDGPAIDPSKARQMAREALQARR